MLTAKRTLLNPDTLEVHLSGSIVESVDLEVIIGEVPSELHLHCKEVERINSMGVKRWIQYFNRLREKGTRLHFHECSSAIVQQANLIPNFACGGTIESICLPFICEKCSRELVAVMRSEDARRIDLDKIDLKCSRCSSRLIFDDDPATYLQCLSR